MFKNRLSTTCQKLAILNGRRRWDIILLLKALNTSIGDVLNNRSWRKAFEDLGYRGNQIYVSQRVLDKVDVAERPEVPNGIPSLENLMSCFPKRTNIPLGHMFSAVLKADRLAEELGKGQPLGADASHLSSASGSRGPHPRLVPLSTGRPVADRGPGVEDAERASPLRPPPALVPRLTRLGSSKRIGSEPTAHKRKRPPLPPPIDDPPGRP